MATINRYKDDLSRPSPVYSSYPAYCLTVIGFPIGSCSKSGSSVPGITTEEIVRPRRRTGGSNIAAVKEALAAAEDIKKMFAAEE